MAHWLRKLDRTLRMLGCLFMARMFGKYEHSGWNETISYARYRWRGVSWIIPTSCVEEPVEIIEEDDSDRG
jgi:hypothetical protein